LCRTKAIQANGNPHSSKGTNATCCYSSYIYSRLPETNQQNVVIALSSIAVKRRIEDPADVEKSASIKTHKSEHISLQIQYMLTTAVYLRDNLLEFRWYEANSKINGNFLQELPTQISDEIISTVSILATIRLKPDGKNVCQW
jgi:hypothetical protein